MVAYILDGRLKLRRKVRAIVINEAGEFLLVRPHGYGEGEWTLTGGGVEQGETTHQAMRREIAEELGMILEENIQILPVSNRIIYGAEHKTKCNLDHDGQEATMFVVRLTGDASLSLQAEEIAEARWFSKNEALGAFPVQQQREIFQACLATLAA